MDSSAKGAGGEPDDPDARGVERICTLRDVRAEMPRRAIRRCPLLLAAYLGSTLEADFKRSTGFLEPAGRF